MYERQSQNTSTMALPLLRLGIILLFLLMIGRLYQLQIVQGQAFVEQSDENRYRAKEVPAPRGVIYDSNGSIIARNRPSFQIVVIPEFLPVDDVETEQDEEKEELIHLLNALRADADEDVAIQIAETMFRRLGRTDYAHAVESVGITLPVRYVPASPELAAEVEGSQLTEEGGYVIPVPDVTVPLPVPGLAALVQRAIEIGRQGSTSAPIPILELVDRIRAFEVEEESYRLPGVRIDPVPVRDYTYGGTISSTSHIVGFMGPIPASLVEEYQARDYNNPNEKVGLSGLEYTYQDILRGKPGQATVEVDILGREIRTVGEVVPPQPGHHLHLSIDLRLQQLMAETLQQAMTETEAPWGVTIAMRPDTGSILGMVSLPAFNNNIFAEEIGEEYLALESDPRQPLLNYAIMGSYPPGSVFKMPIVAAALQENVISAADTIVDNGPIYLPNRFFPDDLTRAQKFVSWNHKLGINHGPLNAVQALALSNDIYFYIIGGGFPDTDIQGLGERRLREWSRQFGYGSPTGIDIPGESGAFIPSDQWKRQFWAESWTTGDSYNMSIGQGYVLSTPLQVLVATAAIANGGTLYRPQILHHITDAEGGMQQMFEPKVNATLPLSPEVIANVRQGMWSAVNSDYGTAIAGRLAGIEVAAKTGTAEFCEWDKVEEDCRYRDEEDNLPTHAWYVAFAPYEDPEIIVVTFLYHGGEGSGASLAVTTEILNRYFSEISPRSVKSALQ